MSPAELIRVVEAAKKKMEESAAELDFILAAKYRDEMNALKKLLK
jgi:excinuclease UvrABC nuclease subunit